MPIDIASFPQGAIARTAVDTFELLDGSPLPIHALVLRGASPGPTLYLGSTIHGDEMTGIEVIRRVLDAVEPRVLRGAILAVPVQNPLAYRERTRFLPAHAIEGYWLDVHTAFPGAADGEMAAVVAHRLLGDLIGAADYAIDFHAPLQGGEYVDYAFTPSAEADSTGRGRELAIAFGAPLVMMQEQGLYTSPNMLHEVATRRGVPTFSVEFSANGRIADASAALGLAGVLNVLRALDMIEGAPTARPGQLLASDFRYARATRGGVAEILCRLGQHVRAGDTLARIRNLWFEEVELVRAPCDGMIYRLAVPRPVHGTERIAAIAIPRAS